MLRRLGWAVLIAAVAGCEVKVRQRGAKDVAGDPATTAEVTSAAAEEQAERRAAHDADPLWQAARERLWADPEAAWGRDLAYMNRDPAVVDAALERTIEHQLRGAAPRDMDGVEALVRRAAGAFRHEQTATPEARAALEALLRARYEDPPSVVEQGVVRADMGFVPGTFAKAARGGGWELRASPEVVDQHEWRAPEVARFLRKVAAHAQGRVRIVRLEVKIPRYGEVRRLRYDWDLTAQRILVGEAAVDVYRKAAKVPGGDLTPFLEGKASLLMRDLEAVRTTNAQD